MSQPSPTDPAVFERWVDSTLGALEQVAAALQTTEATYLPGATFNALVTLLENVPQAVNELIGVAAVVEHERQLAEEYAAGQMLANEARRLGIEVAKS